MSEDEDEDRPGDGESETGTDSETFEGEDTDSETFEDESFDDDSFDDESFDPGPGGEASGEDAPREEVPLSSLRERMGAGRRRQERSEGADGDEDGDSTEVPDEDAPLSDVAESVAGGGTTDDEDPFEEMGIGEVDTEAVWDSFVEDEDPTVEPEVTPGRDGSVSEVDAGGTGAEHVVEKQPFCHRCRFFADPPETRCTHEGTDIVAVLDNEHFRVRNCPMVAEGEGDRPNFDAGSDRD